jgi:predicted ATPase
LRRVRPHRPTSDDERATIGAICRLVEGMPLAIELAAAWSSTLSVGDIEREIEQNIDFLEIPLRDVPARHRSMRAVFDQSWELLPPEERNVFQRLSLFRGGFSREAAEYVTGASLPVLSSFVSKSILSAEPHGRYSVHELLRQYGERQLATHQREELRTKDRYSRYFLTYVADREEALTGLHQKEALAEITSEMANIRNGWRIAIQMQMKSIINQAIHGLWLFYVLRGWMREGESAFGEVVEAFATTRPTTVTVMTRYSPRHSPAEAASNPVSGTMSPPPGASGRGSPCSGTSTTGEKSRSRSTSWPRPST